MLHLIHGAIGKGFKDYMGSKNGHKFMSEQSSLKAREGVLEAMRFKDNVKVILSSIAEDVFDQLILSGSVEGGSLNFKHSESISTNEHTMAAGAEESSFM